MVLFILFSERLRFEGKHQYFKNLTNKCRNFRNITVTLSSRHQLKQCWEFSTNNILDHFERVPGGSVSTLLLSLPTDLQSTSKASGNCKDTELEGSVIQCVSAVTVDTIEYAVKDVLTLDFIHVEKIPVLVQIKYILNLDTMWVFAVNFCSQCPLNHIFMHMFITCSFIFLFLQVLHNT